MTNILAHSCPPNYRCGGPSYAAQTATDSILHIMKVGMAILQHRRTGDTSIIETFAKDGAICGPSMFKAFTRHKSQILGGALHSIIANIRTGGLRECPEVSEEAMLMLVEWYLQKSGTKADEFLKKLDAGGHDQLVELDKTESQI
jgi:hypothetical protein